MKFLPLRDFDAITNALNFSTPDYHVIGGCDVYTTKSARNDKKLHRQIEDSLESQYETLVRLSASLSPPRCRASSAEHDEKKSKTRKAKPRGASVGVPEIYLSRLSPFGTLSQAKARRTFAYLIMVLNASHPDYDFSHILRPHDFRKERSLRAIKQNVDSTLMNLRPRSQSLGAGGLLAPTTTSRRGPSLGASEIWMGGMWELMDKAMGLDTCEKYSYSPEESADPFDEDEGCIWSLHYFFYSKERRRVCYLYLRGLSVISHSPVHVPTHPVRGQRKASSISVGDGAGKRASYWLGSLSAGGVDTTGYGDDDDDEMVDEVDEVPGMDLDDIRSDLAQGFFPCDVDDVDYELTDGVYDSRTEEMEF